MLGIARLGDDHRVQRGEAARGGVVGDDLAHLLDERVGGRVARGVAHTFVALTQHLGEELFLGREMVQHTGGGQPHPLRHLT